ncbi:hypothetical protein FB567DRAFT_552078 [Paraphoma chrysanthemicola]|uniref:Uncharacterized protein n=1 Tax=Paraphoma chrysanthemicola TaxID=798071 RepID=A0A8K0QZB7_9PLEO|nr:hypothetical protein FB567DRAFT_552078 [Paraphoma chrysanthemicola]
MAPRARSFFDLPYDIRAIVYSYLEPQNVPPLSPAFESGGFMFSCRQAKQELEEMASKELKRFLDHFARSTGVEIRLSSTVGELKSVTVHLPFRAFSGRGWDGEGIRVMWKREIMTCLHPLFAQAFDKVRIHIAADPDTQIWPQHESLSDRGRFEVTIHSLLRDIAYMIERVNRDRETWHADGAQFKLDQIFGYEHGKKSESYPTAHVNARRISLSWDLRGTTEREQTVRLNGRMHHLGRKSVHISTRESSFIGPIAASANAIRALLVRGEEELDPPPARLADYESMLFYHLRDSQRLVGEMCIQSKWRWPPREDWRFNELLNGATTNLEYISSRGLGKRVEKGLKGVEQDDYEAEDEAMQRALPEVAQSSGKPSTTRWTLAPALRAARGVFMRPAAARQSSPFFSRLPYDIRLIVYTHLLASNEPLIAPKYSCPEFVLCCRQAKCEIDELHSKSRRTFIADFEASTGVQIEVQHSPSTMKNVTILLPSTAFDEGHKRPFNPKWKRAVLVALHPIFAQRFDIVRIHILIDQTAGSRGGILFPDVKSYESRSLMRDLAIMIERVNRWHLFGTRISDLQKREVLEEIFNHDSWGNIPLYPSAEVRAKRICLTWDSRPNPCDEVRLGGWMHEARISWRYERSNALMTLKRKAKMRQMGRALKEKYFIEEDSGRDAFCMFYEMKNGESVAGESGLISTGRWGLLLGSLRLEYLVDHVGVENRRVVSSNGFGQDIKGF